MNDIIHLRLGATVSNGNRINYLYKAIVNYVLCVILFDENFGIHFSRPIIILMVVFMFQIFIWQSSTDSSDSAAYRGVS